MYGVPVLSPTGPSLKLQIFLIRFTVFKTASLQKENIDIHRRSSCKQSSKQTFYLIYWQLMFETSPFQKENIVHNYNLSKRGRTTWTRWQRESQGLDSSKRLLPSLPSWTGGTRTLPSWAGLSSTDIFKTFSPAQTLLYYCFLIQTTPCSLIVRRRSSLRSFFFNHHLFQSSAVQDLVCLHKDLENVRQGTVACSQASWQLEEKEKWKISRPHNHWQPFLLRCVRVRWQGVRFFGYYGFTSSLLAALLRKIFLLWSSLASIN